VQVQSQAQAHFSVSQQQADIDGNDWNFERIELRMRLFAIVENG
jgi:hypothetical protein